MDVVIPIVLNAVTLISILMLVALGLAIIFGLMNVINMAHGEFVTIGAFTLAFVQRSGGSFWLALALGASSFSISTGGLSIRSWRPGASVSPCSSFCSSCLERRRSTSLLR